MTIARVRTIDLEDPFVASFEGMCEVLTVNDYSSVMSFQRARGHLNA